MNMVNHVRNCRESSYRSFEYLTNNTISAGHCLKQILVSSYPIVVCRNPRKSIRQRYINHAQKADEGPKSPE